MIILYGAQLLISVVLLHEIRLHWRDTTWRSCLKCLESPGCNTTRLLTAPGSTQIIFWYSSSPKSAILAAFSAHGFQITKVLHYKLCLTCPLVVLIGYDEMVVGWSEPG